MRVYLEVFVNLSSAQFWLSHQKLNYFVKTIIKKLILKRTSKVCDSTYQIAYKSTTFLDIYAIYQNLIGTEYDHQACNLTGLVIKLREAS